MCNLLLTIFFFIGCNPNYGVTKKRVGDFINRVKDIQDVSIDDTEFMPGERITVNVPGADFDPSDKITIISSKEGEEYFIYTEEDKVYISPIIIDGSGKRKLTLIYDDNEIFKTILNVKEEFVSKDNIIISEWQGKANVGNSCYLNAMLHAMAPFVDLGYYKIDFSEKDSEEQRKQITTMNKVAQAIFNSIRLGGRGAISSYGEDGTSFASLSSSFMKKVLQKHFNNCSDGFKINGRQQDAEEFANILIDSTMGKNPGIWKSIYFGEQFVKTSAVDGEEYRVPSPTNFHAAWHIDVDLVENNEKINVQELIDRQNNTSPFEINVVHEIWEKTDEERLEEDVENNSITLFDKSDNVLSTTNDVLVVTDENSEEVKDIIKNIVVGRGEQNGDTLYLPNGDGLLYTGEEIKVNKGDMMRADLKKKPQIHKTFDKSNGYSSPFSVLTAAYVVNFNEKQKIDKAPDVLMLRLKRFTNDRRKISRQIDEIDKITINVKDDETVTYKLKSYVNHSGSFSGGHYTSNIIDEKGEWRHFNDSQVNGHTPHLHNKDQPYILFYEKENIIN